MLRLASVTATLLLIGCASAAPPEVLVPEEAMASVWSSPSAESHDSVLVEPAPYDRSSTGSFFHDTSFGESSEIVAEFDLDARPLPYAPEPNFAPLVSAPMRDEGLRENRTTLKLGYWGSTEDELDDGYILNASWMRFFTGLFAAELELGYLEVDGDDGGVDSDVWAIPIMLNGRINAPLWILDIYGGAGIGTFYYDAEVKFQGLKADEDGFLLGGNLFLGSSLNLADTLALGLEFKYYLTEDADDFDAGLDAYALMLTLGWSF